MKNYLVLQAARRVEIMGLLPITRKQSSMQKILGISLGIDVGLQEDDNSSKIET